MHADNPSDTELVRSAQAGEAASLGLLLTRHHAALRAVALSFLGYGPDAEDVLQETSLTALNRIGDLRDPAAVRPWLTMIVRNACRTRLRGDRRTAPLDDVLPATGPTPEQVVERHALRDWIWHAIGELSEPHQLVVLLRHFTPLTSYEQIAAICDVPVGTVRSRLSAARAALGTALRATADLAHDDATAMTAASRAEAVAMLQAAERGDFAKVVADRWLPEARMTGGCRGEGGRDAMVRAMNGNLEQGIRQRLAHAVVSRDLTVWEMDVTTASGEVQHCPPAIAMIMSQRGGRYDRMRLFPWQSGRKQQPDTVAARQ